MKYFKSAGGVFGFDLQDAEQCVAALALVAPSLHADRVAAMQAITVWNAAVHAEKTWIKAKQRHDEWAAHKAAYDAWLAADDPELPKVAKPSPEPHQPGDRPPAPGDQPPAVPDVTAADVLGNLSSGWEDVTGNWPPPPTAEEQAAAAQAERVAKYLRRAQSAPRLVAEFAAENEVRLASGQWTLAQLQAVINDPSVATLIRLLQSASYESALALVQSLNGGVYTAELKASWIAKIRGAM